MHIEFYQTAQQALRKISDAAESRMRERTAREQHAAHLAELQRDRDESIPDAEDDMSLRNNIIGA